MKCANCDRDALYVYQINKHVEIFYCGSDLPNFLEVRRRAGLLKTTEQLKIEKEAALEALSSTSSEPKAKKKKKVTEELSEE